MNGEDYYRKRAWWRAAGIAAVFVIAGGAFWYLARTDSFQKISALESSAERIAAQEISKSFSAPPPLIATGTQAESSSEAGASSSSYALTRAGVIADTNGERAANGNLPPLSESAALDSIASLRLSDLFARQYFAHISPPNAEGVTSSAETAAAAAGYDYIALGENLALGNFDGDQGVVTAWMNSPGHRANILNTHYSEIGVAVGEGKFQGEDVWIAVQVFGKPLTACPAPDAALKASIAAAQNQISNMKTELQTKQAQLDAEKTNPGSNYSQEVANYNALVDQYNQLVAQAKSQVAQYNTEVDAYNACVGN